MKLGKHRLIPRLTKSNTKLKSLKDKRCFVFIHAYIEEDSGDPMDVRENSIFEYWGTTKKMAFINLLNQYKT